MLWPFARGPCSRPYPFTTAWATSHTAALRRRRGHPRHHCSAGLAPRAAEVRAWRGIHELRRVRRVRLSFYARLPLREGAWWRMTLRLRAPKGRKTLGVPIQSERSLPKAWTPWATPRVPPGPWPAPIRTPCEAASRLQRPWGLCARRRGRFHPFAGGGVTAGIHSLGPAGVTGRVVHLFVVSGFHLGLVLVALRVLTHTPAPRGWLDAGSCCRRAPLLAAYGSYAGGGAAGAAGLARGAPAPHDPGAWRGSRPGRGLALAALALGVTAPEALLAPGGAALSFFAVLVLLWPGGRFGPPGSADPPGASVFGHGCPPCYLLWLDARRGPGGESIPGAAPGALLLPWALGSSLSCS